MKKITKILSLFLIALTLFTVSPIIEKALPADKTVAVAEAASIRLNKTAVTLIEGNSIKLKVKGTKKKVKWSTSKKKVATVKNGKVTAKKEGTATITAKVAGKKLKCKVTVKPVPVTTKKIAATYYKTTNLDGVVGFLKNNNNRAVSVTLTVVFYDAAGKMIGNSSDFNYCLESGRTCVMHAYNPYVDGKRADFKTFKTNLKVSDSYYTKKCKAKNIVTTSNISDGKIFVESTNIGTKKFDTINISVVYYDGNGNVIAADDQYLDCKDPGSSAYNTFYIPNDNKSDDYVDITFASYKIIVNHAYAY